MKNQGLKDQLNSVTSQFSSLQQLIRSMKHQALPQPQNQVVGQCQGRCQRQRSRIATTPSNHYCWTHRGTLSHRHTSTSCNYQKLGHDATAILHDAKGGSQKFLDLRSSSWKARKINSNMHVISHDYINKLSVNPTSTKYRPSNNTNFTIADSDTSSNDLHVQAPMLNKVLIHNGSTVIIPDDTTIKASHKGTFLRVQNMLNVSSFR